MVDNSLKDALDRLQNGKVLFYSSSSVKKYENMETGYKQYMDATKELYDQMFDYKKKHNQIVVNLQDEKITQANDEAEKMRQIMKDSKNVKSDSRAQSIERKQDKERKNMINPENQKKNEEVYQTLMMNNKLGDRYTPEDSLDIKTNLEYKYPKLEKVNSNKFFSPKIKQGSEKSINKNLLKSKEGVHNNPFKKPPMANPSKLEQFGY